MILLLSFQGEWLLAAVIVSIFVGLLGLEALNQDIEENPWKYKKFLDADEAKKKAKEQAQKRTEVQDNH